MKKLVKYLSAAAIIVFAAACQKDDIKEPPKVIRNSDGIPTISIKTDSGSPVPSDKNQSIGCQIKVIAAEDATIEIDAPGEIHGRGNATWGYEKKPYKIKFQEKQSVCGMPANKDWVLLALYCDKSLMREHFMHTLAESVGIPYVIRHEYVELILNGDNLGVYLVTEQVEKAKDRVPAEDDGFIIELDNYWNKEPLWITTARGHYLTFKYPNPSKGNIVKDDESYKFILDYMNKFESALNGSDFKDPAKGYRAYVDASTFAKWFLVQELCGNMDTNFYMTLRNRSSKLEAMPLWDCEWSFGLAASGANGWATPPAKPIVQGSLRRNGTYIRNMLADPYFVDLVKSEWAKLKPQIPTIKAQLRKDADYLKQAQATTFRRWPILDKYVSVGLIHLDSWEAEVDYVFNFFDEHSAWFDGWLQTL